MCPEVSLATGLVFGPQRQGSSGGLPFEVYCLHSALFCLPVIMNSQKEQGQATLKSQWQKAAPLESGFLPYCPVLAMPASSVSPRCANMFPMLPCCSIIFFLRSSVTLPNRKEREHLILGVLFCWSSTAPTAPKSSVFYHLHPGQAVEKATTLFQMWWKNSN